MERAVLAEVCDWRELPEKHLESKNWRSILTTEPLSDLTLSVWKMERRQHTVTAQLALEVNDLQPQQLPQSSKPRLNSCLLLQLSQGFTSPCFTVAMKCTDKTETWISSHHLSTYCNLLSELIQILGFVKMTKNSDSLALTGVLTGESQSQKAVVIRWTRLKCVNLIFLGN